MKSGLKKFACLAAIPAALSATSPTYADASGTLAVGATVLDGCLVVATPLLFGSLEGVGGSNIDSQSVLTLTCTSAVNYEIELDDGQNALSGARRMVGTVSGGFLPYEIYTASDYGTRWGNTAGSTVTGSGAIGASTIDIYGRIPASVSTVAADAYTDSVAITVNF